MAEVRYGYYLRPSPQMCNAQVRIHLLLERQFGLRVAGRFMPHATIKGFFASEADVDHIRESAKSIVDGLTTFPVFSQGAVGFGSLGIALSIMRMPDLAQNDMLQALHDRALEVLMPLVSGTCNFTPNEWLGVRFEAHLTLAMADIPSTLFNEVLQFVQALEPVGPEMFMAERLHLYAFESEDWHADWWDSLRWELIDSWNLSPSLD
ncbi:hypothetical protein BH23CHL5_BH23CHL5_04270 [soil metagenome]